MKERTIRGKKYLYVSGTASYKGKKKRFEKLIGPKGMNREKMERKVTFYSNLIDEKCKYYKLLLRSEHYRNHTVSKRIILGLEMIHMHYQNYLASLYPSALEKYTREFNVRYVHHTTAMEGNTLSLRETSLLLDHGLSPQNKHLREVYEIENYHSILDFVSNPNKKLSLRFICRLNRLVQNHIDDNAAGDLRKVDISISGSDWKPTPHVFVEEELKDLIEWYSRNARSMHPFEVAALFHHRFTQIHPFVDGNGRVGRELMNFILRKSGYPPIIIHVERRKEYLDALEEADNGNDIQLLKFLYSELQADYMDAVGEFFTGLVGDEGLKEEILELTTEEKTDLTQTMMWIKKLFREYMANTVP